MKRACARRAGNSRPASDAASSKHTVRPERCRNMPADAGEPVRGVRFRSSYRPACAVKIITGSSGMPGCFRRATKVDKRRKTPKAARTLRRRKLRLWSRWKDCAASGAPRKITPSPLHGQAKDGRARFWRLSKIPGLMSRRDQHEETPKPRVISEQQ